MYFTFPKKQYKVHSTRLLKLIKLFFKRFNNNYDPKRDLIQNISFACHPALKDFYYGVYDNIVFNSLGGISAAFKAPTMKLAIKKAFRCKGNKITRLVLDWIKRNKSFNVFRMGFLLQGLIPYEYFYELIPEIKYIAICSTSDKIKTVRKLLQNYGKERLLILAKKENFWYGNTLYDTAKMFEDYPDLLLPDKPANIIEIHNSLSREYRRRKTPEVKFNIKEDLLKLENILFGPNNEYTLVFPKSNYDLISWGEKLSNCIASYADYMRNNYSLLLGIKKVDDLVSSVEIRNKKIIQIVGHHNQRLQAEEQEIIERFLFENKVINFVSKDYEWAKNAQKEIFNY